LTIDYINRCEVSNKFEINSCTPNIFIDKDIVLFHEHHIFPSYFSHLELLKNVFLRIHVCFTQYGGLVEASLNKHTFSY